jgi:hypothetical protein
MSMGLPQNDNTCLRAARQLKTRGWLIPAVLIKYGKFVLHFFNVNQKWASV